MLRPLCVLLLVAAPSRAFASQIEEEDPERSGWWEDIAVGLHANVLLSRDDDFTVDEEGREVGDSARVRQVALDVLGPLGRGAEAFAALAMEADPLNEFDGELKQAWVRVELTPAGWPVEVKLGRLRSRFGRNNRWRLFELPQPTRPLAVQEFLGADGFLQTGGSLALELPVDSPRHQLSLALELYDTGDIALSGAEAGQGIAQVVDFDWTWWPSRRSSVLSGVSGYHGRPGENLLLAGGDVLVSWLAERQGEPRLRQVGAELFFDLSDETPDAEHDAFGAYAWTQIQLRERWFAGARYDYVERVRDPNLDVHQGGLYLSWLFSSRLRLTGGWEHAEGDERGFQSADHLYAEASLSIGANPLAALAVRHGRPRVADIPGAR